MIDIVVSILSSLKVGLDYNALFYTAKANFARAGSKNCKNVFHKKFVRGGSLFGGPCISENARRYRNARAARLGETENRD